MSLYDYRYGEGRNFSSGSHGSLSGRPRISGLGYQPGLQRASSSNLSMARQAPLLSQSPAFLLSSMPTLDIDPMLHQIRSQEKETIKKLNDQFVSFIDKARELERQNKILTAQRDLLRDTESYKSNIDQIANASSNNLKQQIGSLQHEKKRLEAELANMEALLKDLKDKYEDEINRRNQLENEFVLTKKDLDNTYLQKVDLESQLDSTSDEIDYLKQLYDEEIKELESQIHNTEITVEMDNSKNLEMQHIMEDVKRQYQLMADKSQQDAEQWYKSKLDDMDNQNRRYNDDLKNIKNEITDISRQIQRSNGDLDGLKAQRANLENAIGMTEDQGEQAINNCKSNIQSLEDALRKAKQDMAEKARKYQELMSTKLALDIEIATYRKLLEGEETRLNDPTPVQTQMTFNQTPVQMTFNPTPVQMTFSPIDRQAGSLAQDVHPVSATTNISVSSAPPKKPVMIKTIETVNGITERSQYSKEQSK